MGNARITEENAFITLDESQEAKLEQPPPADIDPFEAAQIAEKLFNFTEYNPKPKNKRKRFTKGLY